MKKIRAWISAARMRTLPLSIAGILVATAAAIKVDAYNATIFVLALLTTLGFQILSNFANDYGDGVKGTDNEERVGPKRAMQQGLLTAKELKYGMFITALLTLFLASLLIFTAFGNEQFIISLVFFNLGIAAVVAAITYTVGKKAYGYRALGDVFVFIFFGLVGVIGCYFLYTQSFSNYIGLPAITIGLLSTAVLNLNNMRDRISDARVHKNTLAVYLGENKVKQYHAFLIIGALLCAFLYSFFTYESWTSFIPLLAFVPLLLNVRMVFSNDDPRQLDPELKKVALGTFGYALLMFGINFLF